MEWKLKRTKAFLSCRGAPPVPDGRCMVIEWADATRAVETSMGDWKKGGQWGGGVGPCWLSDKERTQLLACERGRRWRERYSLVPARVLCNGVPASYFRGHQRLRREEMAGSCLEWDRTGQHGRGEHLLSSGVFGSHLLAYGPALPSALFAATAALLPEVFVGREASARCQSLYHTRASRGVHGHTS